MNIKLKNFYGENLDVLIEGNESSNKILIFVHGFGTNKDEGFNLFKDISESLKNEFLCLRFDFNSYGLSEGLTEEFNFIKAKEDLKVILDYVNEIKAKEVYILAHSVGCLITSLLSPRGIEKVIFTGIVNSNSKFISNKISNRIKEKGKLNKNGISIYPRSSGEIQKIGKMFWITLEEINIIKLLKKFSEKTKIKIFRPIDDEIVGNEYFEEYKKLNLIDYEELNGNHNFSFKKDRELLIEKIKEFFKN